MIHTSKDEAIFIYLSIICACNHRKLYIIKDRCERKMGAMGGVKSKTALKNYELEHAFLLIQSMMCFEVMSNRYVVRTYQM